MQRLRRVMRSLLGCVALSDSDGPSVFIIGLAAFPGMRAGVVVAPLRKSSSGTVGAGFIPNIVYRVL